jgi:uncharacterized cupin superfamily protein
MPSVTRLDPAALDGCPVEHEGPAPTRTAELAELGGGLSAGLWSAEPHVVHVDSYPWDEVCFILEGTVSLHLNDSVETFGPGEAFAIARGTECTWEQPGQVRKVYVIREET